jgi:DNA-binding Lrp family transcriptional regulator
VSLSVRAVERALDILLCFTSEEPIQSLSQIAESVHLSKPTVHRLLATLEKKQFIAKDQVTSRYRLGIRGLGFGSRKAPGALKEEAGNSGGLKINAPPSSRTVPVFISTASPRNPQASTSFGNR